MTVLHKQLAKILKMFTFSSCTLIWRRPMTGSIPPTPEVTSRWFLTVQWPSVLLCEGGSWRRQHDWPTSQVHQGTRVSAQKRLSTNEGWEVWIHTNFPTTNEVCLSFSEGPMGVVPQAPTAIAHSFTCPWWVFPSLSHFHTHSPFP